MKLKTETFLALRYFKPKRDAVSVITAISVLGVTLGVAVLIVVLAVMTGFTNLMKEKLLETTAHIQISALGRGYIRNPAPVVDKAIECGAASASPIVRAQALLQNDQRFLAKILVGIEPMDDQPEGLNLIKAIKAGNGNLDKDEIVISEIIAAELGVGLNDKILVHAPNKLAKMVRVGDKGRVEIDQNAEMYLPREFTVTGIYSFGKYDFDRNVVFTGLDDADELFGLPWGAATAVYAWTENPFQLDHVITAMSEEMPSMHCVSWRQLNAPLLGVLTVEKNMMFFLLIFIVLVAAFSITNTLITVVVQKTREIGLLKALGAGRRTIQRVFILQGFIVGLLGTVCGTALGVTVVIWRNEIMRLVSTVFRVELFPKEFYFFNELPADIVPGDLIWIAVISVALCTVGALIPAWRAARLDPANALRYE